METIQELYVFLQEFTEDNLINWLKEPWVGKDKQESLLRLFAGLGIIDKLNAYQVCKGNFNKKTITTATIWDTFYRKDNAPVKLKDKGDSSDLTCISKTDSKHLLLTTSKNISNLHVGKLDIDKILTNFQKYSGYTMSLCVCIRNEAEYLNMKNNIEDSSADLRAWLDREDTIVIDWNDLNQAYHEFKTYFSDIPISQLRSDRNVLCLKMHQHLSVAKTLSLKRSGKSKILWGHIQRSGKSYIIAGCIIEDARGKDACNYLVMTTAPKETLDQQRSVLSCLQLQEFSVIMLDGKTKKPTLTDKNIVVCSKQFLQNKIGDNEKTRSIAWLKKLDFDMRFIDESHNGGTTELAQKTLDFYGRNSFTVQITATYTKPVNDFNIPKENWILWDLEDIKLCKKGCADSINRLAEKHGDEVRALIAKYSPQNIAREYSKYPELWLLTDELRPEVVKEILSGTTHNNYGWSSEACFLLRQAVNGSEIVAKEEFQNEAENLKIWYRIFGKRDKYGIPDREYPDSIVFMKRIERICKNPTINSRYIGEGDFYEEPMIIMAFLPQNNIDKISKATIQLLRKYNVVPDYELLAINNKTTSDPKQSIEDARVVARNSGKKGVLVLSGRQCSLGVSIANCDIVVLLNNNMGFDMIYQMMFRCMTEGKGKTCGFVVDLNIHRVIETSIMNYASLVRPADHPKEATKFVLQERLINLNGDHWMPTFGNHESKIATLCENIYNIYSANTETALKHFLDRLQFKTLLLTKEEYKIFNAMFSNKTPTEKQKELIDKLMQEDEEIQPGIEKIKVEKNAPQQITENDDKPKSQVNYMDILKHIIPLVCLLTIHSEESTFIEMFNVIENDKQVYDILIDQTKSWWGKNVDARLIKKFISVYIKYMRDDKETNRIIRTVKELFAKNIGNSRQLSQLIDKYLIPQELEKKSNAEVSTPYFLRQEMLDKIPTEFWTKPRKVFEPCAGKGGFVVDIIDRFMIGLKDSILDEKERYKTIVEDCLYFSDINPTNIFICRLLVDPYSEYAVNCNEGDTLKLNIKDKWGFESFDAVISNPPYNSSGNTGTGNTIWQKFTQISLTKWIAPDGYLLFVHPPGWRKPNTKKGKFYGLFDLMTKTNQMLYLSIHGIKDGQTTFRCGTRYDWYLIQKRINFTQTEISDENRNKININLREMLWLPNSNILEIKRMLAKTDDRSCPIMYDRTAYGADKKDRMSAKETSEFKYPCIHSTPKAGVRYMYSRVNDRGHFGISKVIFGDSGIYNPIIDIEGKYGMTQHAMAIQVDDLEEAKKICEAITSDKFNVFIKSCLFSSYALDWNIFTDFKKDFWKEFI